MKKRRMYKPGMRALKTVMAVSLCLLIAQLVPGDNQGLYSSFAAIVCMQPTTQESFRLGVHRIVGTVIGGVFGFLVLLGYDWLPVDIFPDTSWLVIPLAMLMVISLCNLIQEAPSSSIACIVVLAIAYDQQIGASGAFTVAVHRVLETLAGIVIALVVNRFIAPPPKTPPDTLPASDHSKSHLP